MIFFRWSTPAAPSGKTNVVPQDNDSTHEISFYIPYAFVDDETPSGTINGSNDTFTLAHTPIAGSVRLYANGIRLISGTAYTISGLTITMQSGWIPQSGDTLRAEYRYN